MEALASLPDRNRPDASTLKLCSLLAQTVVPNILESSLQTKRAQKWRGEACSAHIIEFGSEICQLLFNHGQLECPLFIPRSYLQLLPEQPIRLSRPAIDKFLIVWTRQLRRLLQRSPNDVLSANALPADEHTFRRAHSMALQQCETLLEKEDVIKRIMDAANEFRSHYLSYFLSTKAQAHQASTLTSRHCTLAGLLVDSLTSTCAASPSLETISASLPDLVVCLRTLQSLLSSGFEVYFGGIVRRSGLYLINRCLEIDVQDLQGHQRICDAWSTALQKEALLDTARPVPSKQDHGKNPKLGSMDNAIAADLPFLSSQTDDFGLLPVRIYAASCKQEEYMCKVLQQIHGFASTLSAWSAIEQTRLEEVHGSIQSAKDLLAAHHATRIRLVKQGLMEDPERETPFMLFTALVTRIEMLLMTLTGAHSTFLPDQLAMLAACAQHIVVDGPLKGWIRSMVKQWHSTFQRELMATLQHGVESIEKEIATSNARPSSLLRELRQAGSRVHEVWSAWSHLRQFLEGLCTRTLENQTKQLVQLVETRTTDSERRIVDEWTHMFCEKLPELDNLLLHRGIIQRSVRTSQYQGCYEVERISSFEVIEVTLTHENWAWIQETAALVALGAQRTDDDECKQALERIARASATIGQTLDIVLSAVEGANRARVDAYRFRETEDPSWKALEQRLLTGQINLRWCGSAHQRLQWAAAIQKLSQKLQQASSSEGAEGGT